MAIPSTISIRPGQDAGSKATVATKTGLSIKQEQISMSSRKIRFVLTSVSIAMTDGTTNGSIGSQKLCDLPEGLVIVDGAVSDLTFTAASGIGATGAVKHSIGSAAEATNDTLDSVQANVIPSTSKTLAASTGSKTGVSTGAAYIDGHTTAAALYLNLGVADADSTANSTITVTGTIDVEYRVIGDGAN